MDYKAPKLFDKETIDDCLAECSKKSLNKIQLKNITNKLNVRQNELPTEWEIIVISSFCKFGEVFYEPGKDKSSHPDILFIPDSSFSIPVKNIVADIVTISDKGLDKRAGFKELIREINMRINKLSLSTQFFCFKILGRGSNSGKLSLENDNKEALKKETFRFLYEKCKKFPNEKFTFTRKLNNCKFEMTYNPCNIIQVIEYTPYTMPMLKDDIEKNNIYKSLKKKHTQLIKYKNNDDSKCTKGIILCDGGCDALEIDNTFNVTRTYKEIINRFLSKFKDIDFIILFRPMNDKMSDIPVSSTAFYSTVDIENTYSKLFEQIGNTIPHLKQNPYNARII